MGVLGMGRLMVSMAMRVAAMVNRRPRLRPYFWRSSAGDISRVHQDTASSGAPLVTSIAPKSDASSTTTILGCSMPAVDLDGVVAHPRERDDRRAGAFRPVLGEGLEVLALAQGQLRHHLGGGDGSLAAARVPAYLGKGGFGLRHLVWVGRGHQWSRLRFTKALDTDARAGDEAAVSGPRQTRESRFSAMPNTDTPSGLPAMNPPTAGDVRDPEDHAKAIAHYTPGDVPVPLLGSFAREGRCYNRPV